MENVLQIGAVVDLASVQGGMTQAASIVGGAAEQMTFGFVELKKGADAAGDAGLEAGKKIASGMEKASFSMKEAKGSMMLLGEEIGVKIPRHLQGFIANLPGVGAAMEFAFSGIAVIALIELIGKVVEKIRGFIDAGKNAAKAWAEVGSAMEKFGSNTDTKLLEIQLKVDELNNNHVAVLHDKIKLLDRQTLKNLGAEFTEIAKLADKAFLEMQKGETSFWFGGHWNSAAAQVKSDLDAWNEKLEKLTITGSKDDVAAALQQQLEDVKAALASEQAAASKGEGHTDRVAALKQELALVQDQVTVYGQLDKVQRAEKNYYNLSAYKDSAKEKLKIDGDIFKAREEMQKQLDKDDEQASKIDEVRLQEQLKGELILAEAKLKVAQNAIKTADLELDAEREAAKQKYDIDVQQINAAATLGAISAQQKIALLRKALNDEHEAEKAATEKKLLLLTSTDPDYPEQRQKILNQLAQLEGKNRQQSLALDNAALENRKKLYDNFFGTISKGFSGTINGMIAGTQGFSQGMSHMFQNVVLSFADSLQKMMTQWIEHLILKNILHKAAKQQEQMTETLSDAKQAATGAYKAMVGIPVVGPILAPIAAGVAYAGVLALGSAAQGAMVPQDMLMNVHKQEMILPAHIAQPLQSALGNGKFGSGGDMHFHNQTHIHAMDGPSVKQHLNEHGDLYANVVMKKAQQAFKRGAFK